MYKKLHIDEKQLQLPTLQEVGIYIKFSITSFFLIILLLSLHHYIYSSCSLTPSLTNFFHMMSFLPWTILILHLLYPTIRLAYIIVIGALMSLLHYLHPNSHLCPSKCWSLLLKHPDVIPLWLELFIVQLPNFSCSFFVMGKLEFLFVDLVGDDDV